MGMQFSSKGLENRLGEVCCQSNSQIAAALGEELKKRILEGKHPKTTIPQLTSTPQDASDSDATSISGSEDLFAPIKRQKLVGTLCSFSCYLFTKIKYFVQKYVFH